MEKPIAIAVSPPCCICGKSNVKRRAYTITKGNYSQRLFVCKTCRKLPDFRNRLSDTFFVLTPHT